MRSNLLESAINDDDRDHAVSTIRQALGIADEEVADYSLPGDWASLDKEKRARLLAEWLSNELRFMVAA
jgi:hypothetical protein